MVLKDMSQTDISIAVYLDVFWPLPHLGDGTILKYHLNDNVFSSHNYTVLSISSDQSIHLR